MSKNPEEKSDKVKQLSAKMARNSDNSDNTDSEELIRRRQVRLRRCPSTSKVESIVTEDEKLRRAQPDKP